eukprot:scaffold22750_cov96-Isochrysis_galbana.AAC.1
MRKAVPSHGGAYGSPGRAVWMPGLALAEARSLKSRDQTPLTTNPTDRMPCGWNMKSVFSGRMLSTAPAERRGRSGGGAEALLRALQPAGPAAGAARAYDLALLVVAGHVQLVDDAHKPRAPVNMDAEVHQRVRRGHG